MELTKLSIIFCLINLKLTVAHPQKSQICTSDECHHQAESLLSKIDTSISPCDDFYQFTCGNYKDQGSIHAEHQANIIRNLTDLAREKITENDENLLKLVKQFYQSCEAERDSFDFYLRKDMNIRRRTAEYEVEFSWGNVIQDLQFFQNSDAYIFNAEIGFVDEKLLLVVDQPKFETKAGFLDRKSEKVQEFYTNFVNFLVNEGNDRAEIEKMKEKALKFEDELLELIDENSKAQTEISTIGELQKIFKFINCTTYMKRFFSGSDLVDENFIIGIKNREILMKLDKFLFESSEDDILNYLVWRFIESAYIAIYYSDEDEKSVRKPYRNQEDSSLKCFTCFCLLKEELNVALAAVYVKKFFNHNENKQIASMIEDMKKELLNNFNWLDDSTKKAAIKKLNKMESYVGYPGKLFDEQFLEDYQRNLNFDNKNFDQILKEAESNKLEKIVENIIHSNMELQIIMIHSGKIIEVNALYNPGFNYFMIFAGIIYNKTFSSNRPASMNFGVTGFTIGHEILHGYDSIGRHFDENGEERNWWSSRSEMEFLTKSQCFVDQYDNYTEPITGLNVDGTLTLGENIADNGGIILAYNSYKNWLKVNKFDQTLPNVNFTPNQLFWISFAQDWCTNYNIDVIKDRIKNDVHSPYQIRIIGALANTKEFSDDFGCPRDSKMNRQEKCKIW